ncbi:GFA family protein [Candidatus Thioglobus sp.]|nr:GFA family protein [Candidatus Thioglobus sp.]
MTSIEYRGSCVCGQTSYSAFDLADVSYCHCVQCRKMTGHYMAACQAKRDKIKIIGKIKWFYTHEESRHGFCDNCGAHMFWQNDSLSTISVTAGSLEDAKNLTVKHNIFTEEKGCYYTISLNETQIKGYGKSHNSKE